MVLAVVAAIVVAWLLWPKGDARRFEVRAPWFAGSMGPIAATEVTEPTGTAVDAGPLVLELDLRADGLERWRMELLEGALVFEDGELVGTVQRAVAEEVGIAQALTLGLDSGSAWVSVVAPPDVSSLRLPDDEVARRTEGWSGADEAGVVAHGTAVWLLHAWGDVVVGDPAVLLEQSDGQVVLMESVRNRADGAPAVVVAEARIGPRTAAGLTHPDEVGPILGGVIAVDGVLTVATTDLLPPTTEVVVTARGLGEAERTCRYRTSASGELFPWSWTACSRALETVGLAQDHYYTPLRVTVTTEGEEPRISVCEPSKDGGSVNGAVRRMREGIDALRKERPRERIEVLVEPLE